MRTKAEALANPMAGDRWWNGTERITLTSTTKGSTTWSDGRWTIRERNTSFRRWAANAEYLGGAE